jgi:hypothetical protein
MHKIPKQYYLELAVFCMNYHSGQRSRGYRILSKLQPRHISAAVAGECEDTEIYAYLVQTYAEKV